MITYLVIHNGEVNKSYKCNTTHTSVPYIRVNEKNYLDLTTETTTGLQLKYKQKTGSSYSTYNTVSQTNTTRDITVQQPIYSGKVTETFVRNLANGTLTSISTSPIETQTRTSLTTRIGSSTYTMREGSPEWPSIMASRTYSYNITDIYSSKAISTTETFIDTYLTTTQSKVTFKNKVYIPVQSQSTTVSTTRSSLYTNTTGYSGRSTYNTTTYTTTGYTGASWWSENHVSTTGYSHSSTYGQTTGTGYRSTTGSTTKSYSTYYTTTDYSNWYNDFTPGYTATKQVSGYGTATSYTGTYSSQSNKAIRWGCTSREFFSCNHTFIDNGQYTMEQWENEVVASNSDQFGGWTGYSNTIGFHTTYTKISTSSREWVQNAYTETWSRTYVANAQYGHVASYTVYETQIGTQSNTFRSTTSILNSFTVNTTTSSKQTTGTGSRSKSSSQTTSTTSRYSTTDYSAWYPDFTAYSTGTRRRTNYYTGTAATVGATELTQGYTTRFSSLASSSIPGQLSSTTALTSSGTRTSSSLKQSSKPGLLVSITELTITSTRTSLTNRTSSTDL